MVELDDYATMIDIVLPDMDLKTVTTKKVRIALKEVFAIDVESQGKTINKLIRKHLDLAKQKTPFKRSFEDLLKDNASMTIKLAKEISISKRSLEEEERNDVRAKENAVKRKKITVIKSPISTRQVVLSKPLADLLGKPQLTRTDVVRKIWAYIKEHNLQNPNNRKEILCDTKLELIFGKSTDMFAMHKILAKHLTDPNKRSNHLPPVKAANGSEQPKASEKFDAGEHLSKENESGSEND